MGVLEIKMRCSKRAAIAFNCRAASAAHFLFIFEIGSPSEPRAHLLVLLARGPRNLPVSVLPPTQRLGNRKLGSGETAQQDYRCALPQPVRVLLEIKPRAKCRPLPTKPHAWPPFLLNTLEKSGPYVFISLARVRCFLLPTSALVNPSSQRSLMRS